MSLLIVEGYRLYTVFDVHGTPLGAVAGEDNDVAIVRAHKRGIEAACVASWHPLYREYAQESDPLERSIIIAHLKDIIYDDVILHP